MAASAGARAWDALTRQHEGRCEQASHPAAGFSVSKDTHRASFCPLQVWRKQACTHVCACVHVCMGENQWPLAPLLPTNSQMGSSTREEEQPLPSYLEGVSDSSLM